MEPMLHCVIRCVLIAVSGMSCAHSVPAQTAPTTTDPIAALTTLTPQPETPGGARIVVQDADGKPVPAAVVVFVSLPLDDHGASRDAAEQQCPGDEPRRLAAQAVHGTRYALDERAETRVPAAAGFVFAMHGERFAHTPIVGRAHQQPFVLTLAPCRTCTVIAVHHDGTPAAGVPVAATGADADVPVVHTRTGADGRAPVRVIDAHGEHATVRLRVASRTPIAAPLPVDGESVRLQLPRVAAVDATLRETPLPGDSLRWRMQAGDFMLTAEPDVAHATTAHFAFVEVGIAVCVAAQIEGREAGMASLDLVRADAPNRILIQRAMPTHCVALRLLDSDGTVARRRAVSVDWKPRSRTQTERMHTNSEGWLELAVPQAFGTVVGVDLALHANDFDSDASAVAHIDLPPVAPGRTEVGEQRCQRLPIAVAATVVDTEGKPVPDLQFTVAQQDHRHTAVKTDAAGQLVLHMAEPIPASLELTVPWLWFFVDQDGTHATVATGLAPVRLVVQHAARIRFAAKGLPDSLFGSLPFDRPGFYAHLEPANGIGPRVEVLFALQNPAVLMPAGDWHFVIRFGDREVHRLDNVHAEAGIETHDPRFMDFDWRAFATLVTVRVCDEKGQPTDDCTVWHERGGSGHGGKPQGGAMQLLLPKDGARVQVQPGDPRYAPIDLGAVTTDQVVRIGGGAQLRAHLAKLPTLPDGVQLLLRTSDTHAGEPFDAQGNAVVWLPSAGPCRPKLGLRQGTQTTFLAIPLETIEVPAGGMNLAIGVSDAVQQAIDQTLRRR